MATQVERSVQTDPTLCYDLAIMQQKKFWELLAQKFDQFQTLCNRVYKQMQHVTPNHKLEFPYPCLECCCEMCTLPRDDVVVVILTDGVNPFGAMLSTFVIIGIINSWLCCATFGETGFS